MRLTCGSRSPDRTGIELSSLSLLFYTGRDAYKMARELNSRQPGNQRNVDCRRAIKTPVSEFTSYPTPSPSPGSRRIRLAGGLTNLRHLSDSAPIHRCALRLIRLFEQRIAENRPRKPFLRAGGLWMVQLKVGLRGVSDYGGAYEDGAVERHRHAYRYFKH